MSQPIYVLNDDKKYFIVNYHTSEDTTRRSYLENQWRRFNRYDPALQETYKIWCRQTNPQMEVTVDRFLPANSLAGRYRIEIFIPAKYSNTRKAIFTITNNIHSENGQNQEENSMVLVDMLDLKDVWHPLGEFYLDPKLDTSIGRVRQYDLSLEDPPVEASYGPVRWVPLFSTPGKKIRYDSPVGTSAERNGPFPSGRVIFGRYPLWAGNWFDVNPFLNWYTYGYHTGADLNLPGSSQADAGKEIYTIADGEVIFAGRAGSWGNIIVIEHESALVTLPDGRTRRQLVYSRYGHVDDRILVRTGQAVKRGTQIGFIGLAANAVAGWHLHFDICYTDLLKKRPSHWPNMNTIQALRMYNHENDSRAVTSSQLGIMKEVLNNYVDPFRFLSDNHE